MHAKGGSQAEKSQQRSRPSCPEAIKSAQPPSRWMAMDTQRASSGSGHVYGCEILHRVNWIPELQSAVPDEEARHQTAREQKQVGPPVLHDAGKLIYDTI